MRKLVKKDSSGRLTEVDTKAMRREAQVLQQYIDEASESDRVKFRYREWLQPLLDPAVDGTLQIPYSGEPYGFHQMLEGHLPWLPNDFLMIYARFLKRIQGSADLSSCSTLDTGTYISGASEEVINGERFEWVVFEE